MAQKTFRCRVVTPTAPLVDDQVTYASVPAWDGLFGVLPGRAPLLARLGMGELRLEFPDTSKGAGGTRTYIVDGGFVRMSGQELTVLAERAVAAEAIVESEVEAELKQIEARSPGGQDRQAQAERRSHDRDLAMLKLRTARGRKGI